MKCPRCGECPFPKGVCERVASRGRRFFLMGALALPAAVAIERIKPIVAPVPEPEVMGFAFSMETARLYHATLAMTYAVYGASDAAGTWQRLGAK